jgi:hypothetical protein
MHPELCLLCCVDVVCFGAQILTGLDDILEGEELFLTDGRGVSLMLMTLLTLILGTSQDNYGLMSQCLHVLWEGHLSSEYLLTITNHHLLTCNLQTAGTPKSI